ncbi:MAG: hypothetical protein WC045_01890 [Patescibacteria group bacterium]
MPGIQRQSKSPDPEVRAALAAYLRGDGPYPVLTEAPAQAESPPKKKPNGREWHPEIIQLPSGALHDCPVRAILEPAVLPILEEAEIPINTHVDMKERWVHGVRVAYDEVILYIRAPGPSWRKTKQLLKEAGFDPNSCLKRRVLSLH